VVRCRGIVLEGLFCGGCCCVNGDVSSTTAFSPLVAPALFPFLWVVLLAAGIAAMGAFFVYELSVTKAKRDITKELTLAVSSSFLLGFGVLYLMLWAGVWV